jgi:hypothetical protein
VPREPRSLRSVVIAAMFMTALLSSPARALAAPPVPQLDCEATLRGDRQRPLSGPLGYDARGNAKDRSLRCEGLIRQDHAGTSELTVERYVVGTGLSAASFPISLSVVPRGLAPGEQGQVILFSKSQGYRLDALVVGGAEFEWPLAEIAKRVPLKLDRLIALGRLRRQSQVVFFPLAIRTPADDAATAGTTLPVLVLRYPSTSPAIAVYLGRVIAQPNRPYTCDPAARPTLLRTWRHVRGIDTLTVPLPLDLPTAFCLRLEIDTGAPGSDPLYHRQEMYFVQ